MIRFSRELQWEFFDRQSSVSKERAIRRVKMLCEIDGFVSDGVRKTKAVEAMALIEGVSVATIWSWLKAVYGIPPNDWLAYLVPSFRGGGRNAALDPATYAAVKADYLRPERPSWEECVRRLQVRAARQNIDLPHSRTIWRRLKQEYSALAIADLRSGNLP